MKSGFLAFIDEAGDQGIEKVRPIDKDGASEYFVLSGLILRSTNYAMIRKDLISFLSHLKPNRSGDYKFRDFSLEEKSGPFNLFPV